MIFDILLKLFRFNMRPHASNFGMRGLFCVCVLCLCGSLLQAEPNVNPRKGERLDLEAAAARIDMFRQQRLQGDYCFRFELQHLPRRGRTAKYIGAMWGSWNDLGPVTRIELYTNPLGTKGDVLDKVELIFQNGAEPSAWIRRDANQSFERIEGSAFFEPIIPSIDYSPFDLQMPFVYWSDFKYEGAAGVQSRVAQHFLMYPPEGSVAAEKGVQAVRIGLDDTYHALLRVEVIDDTGEERSRFTVESFKKIQEQYIVKQITLRNNETRDRTRFKVRAAALGLDLPDAIFDPTKNASAAVLSESLFKGV